MKAAVFEKYGPPDVVEIKDVPVPVPKENEILVKVHYTTIVAADARIRGARPFLVRLFFGLTKPKRHVLGMEFSGTVEKTGSAVTKWKPGDEIFGSAGFNMGAHAEYFALPEDGMIARKPEGKSLKEVTPVTFGGTSALHFLRQADIKPGKKVLIYGASGGVGTAAVQLANYFGAEVTGVCSGTNADMVNSLGAHKVIDYTKEDFSQKGEKYDVIFDTVGKSPFSRSVRSLNKGGFYLRAVNMSPKSIIGSLWTNITSSKKVIGGAAQEKREDLEFLKDLIEKGKFKTVVEKTVPFEKIAEAHKHVDSGRKKGNVVITVAG